jgi:hypothetical protein
LEVIRPFQLRNNPLERLAFELFVEAWQHERGGTSPHKAAEIVFQTLESTRPGIQPVQRRDQFGLMKIRQKSPFPF